MAIIYSTTEKRFVLTFPVSDEDLRNLSLMSNYLSLGESRRQFVNDIINAHYRRCEREGTLREMPVH